MNYEPFGEKCKCGHHESQHRGEMKYKDMSMVHAKTMFGVLPYMESMSNRTNCKLCKCVGFIPDKKTRGFWK